MRGGESNGLCTDVSAVCERRLNMKRLISILLVGLLLCCVALAEDTELNGAADCDHQFLVEGTIREDQLWCIAETDAEHELFESVRCVTCGAEGIVFDDQSLLQPEPCDPEICTHRLYWEPSQSGTRVLWANEYQIAREEYGFGTCIDCGAYGTLRKQEIVPIAVVTEEGELLDACEHEYIVYEQSKPYDEGFESCGELSHAYFKYYWGTCRYCGESETMVVAGLPEQHIWKYDGNNKHVFETGSDYRVINTRRHEYVYKCPVCNGETTETYICPGNGSTNCIDLNCLSE